MYRRPALWVACLSLMVGVSPAHAMLLEKRIAALSVPPVTSPTPTDTLSTLGEEGTRGEETRVSVQLRALGFFRNNEYAADYQVGYTLPGFRLAPTLRLEHRVGQGGRLSLSLGGSQWVLWGAERYPRGGWYDHLPHWSDQEGGSAPPIHIRPLLSLVYNPNSDTEICLGSIEEPRSIGASSSALTLLSPLFDPEYHLSRDPAQGVLARTQWRKLEVEALIDWQGFIFYGDLHQEAFSAFASLRYPLYSWSHGEVDLQLQSVAAHRAGEIQRANPDEALHTFWAGALGGRYRGWSNDEQWSLGGYLLASSIRDGGAGIPSGWGGYAEAALRYGIWGVAADVYAGSDYYSPYGGPLLRPYPAMRGKLLRLGLYPSIECPLGSLAHLTFRGGLWYCAGSDLAPAISHSLELTLAYCWRASLWTDAAR